MPPERRAIGGLPPALSALPSLAAGRSGAAAPVVAVQLAGPTDWAGFVRVARVLVRDGVPAEAVRWLDGDCSPAAVAGGAAGGAGGAVSSAVSSGVCAGMSGDLFDPSGAAVPAADWPAAAPLALPEDWVALARTAALHADPQRWMLIHQLAARLHVEPALAGDPLDPALRRLERLAQAVRREAHKMKAFVRFTPVAAADGTVRHMAWFEPEHHVQERVAPFFTRRFTQMHWLILTPRIGLAWDGATLSHLPGGRREDAPAADAGEALWLAYYRSIFNPARVKVAMMKREMPVRFWANLPEARQIGQLLQQAPQRTAAMLADSALSTTTATAGAMSSAPRQRTRSRAVDQAVAALPSTLARAQADRVQGAVLAPTTNIQADTTADTTADITADTAADKLATRQAALTQLAQRARHCRHCALADAATQTVFGEGPVDARLMLVGEQPGDREDLVGRPFVGPAGQLLRHTLAQLGWNAQRLYLSNAVKHFNYELRGKRRMHKTASQQEAAACVDWLEAEIDAVQPDWLLALGATAARALLGHAVAVSDPAGPWWRRADGRPVLVVLHPAALLRLADAARPAALRDWQAQLALVDGLAGAAADWHLPRASMQAAATEARRPHFQDGSAKADDVADEQGAA